MGGRQTAISIHAPLRGRHSLSAQPKQKQSFQSTPPCGGDAYLLRTGGAPAISIHAPLRGRHKIKAGVLTADISIHAPLRGRPLMLELENFMEYFNPRPLAGATDGRIWGGRSGNISIHAPLRGRLALRCGDWIADDISIHAPLRGRLCVPFVGRHRQRISIHAPLRGRRALRNIGAGIHQISIHAPLRGRHQRCETSHFSGTFQSTPPCGGDLRAMKEHRDVA